ncbi:MAG: MFS transporter [Acetobacteraceae bacterium]
MEQQPKNSSPFHSTHGDRVRIALGILSAPRQYVRPWYIAYLLLGMVTAGLLPVLLPLTVEALSHRLATVAYVLGAYNLGLLTSPLYGTMAERRQLYRQLFLGGFLLTALAVAALPVAGGLAGWVASAFLIGAGSGCAATLATLFVVDFVPRPEWEPRIGWLQSCNAAGQVAGLFLAAAFSDHRWTIGLWVAAGILLPAMLIGGIGLPVPRKEPLPHPQHHEVHAQLNVHVLSVFPTFGLPSGIGVHLHHLNQQGLRHLPEAIRTPFGRFLLSWFMLGLAVSAFFSYFPLMLAKSYGIGANVSAMIYAVTVVFCTGLYVLTSRLASRFGAAAIYRAGLILRIAGFALLLIPFLLPMGGPERTLIGAVGLVVIVLAWPTLSVTGTDLAAHLTPFSEGAAVGLTNAALALATAIGTLISGPLVHRWGYGTIPMMALSGLVISLLVEAYRS